VFIFLIAITCQHPSIFLYSGGLLGHVHSYERKSIKYSSRAVPLGISP